MSTPKPSLLTEHYAQLIGLRPPWEVTRVELSHSEREVRISVACREGAALRCPQCDRERPGYDRRERRWRHLDTMQYRTFLIAEVPRVQCETHGVVQVAVPWAEAGSRFTALFEALVIDWLLEASFAAVSRLLGLSWDAVDGIQSRAVARGLACRPQRSPERIGVDETSFQKRHEYVTVVNDLAAGEVLHVADGRGQEALDGFYRGLGAEGCARLEAVAMDMWAPYIASTREHVPAADTKIVFDKFHVAQHLGDAVDRVRRAESRELQAKGDDRLVRTKYLWLRSPSSLEAAQWRAFSVLRTSGLRVARAWLLKEAAMALWGYMRRGWAERMWQGWCAWAMRSRLEPIKRVARMIRSHWDGVIRAATSSVTNARSEGLNSKIQWIKRKACGYRNRERFRRAIYFHLGGLDLYPAGRQVTHSKA
jgi:transposase